MTLPPEQQSRSVPLSPGERSRRIAALSRLAIMIVHDSNNLLTAVAKNTESIANTLLPQQEATRHFVNNLTESVKFAQMRIMKLQAFLDDGMALFEFISPTLLLERLREPVAELLPPSIRLIMTADKTLPPFPISFPLVRRAILCTAANAVEALSEAGGEYHVTATLKPVSDVAIDDLFLSENLRPESFLCLQISNTGPPIDAEQRESMFDPAFSTRLCAPGLGLCAVMGTMRTHRGCIEVPIVPDGFAIRLLFPHTPPARESIR